MKSNYISFKNSSVHYRQFGSGPRMLFCFHGYGREGDTFYFLEKRLAASFTIIAIDIPFHGLTQWRDETVLQPVWLQQLVLLILKKLDKVNASFSLLGFSMGGRIAMHLTQLMPQKIERLILLAPDGLETNFWRWIASGTWLGYKITNRIIRNPAYVARVLQKAEKWRIIHPNLAGFTGYYLYNDEQRMMFYNKYISMRKLKPSLNQLKRLIKKYKIPVRMMFGKFDKVIPYSCGEKFKQGIEAFVSIKIMNCGHHLLSESNADKIVQLIND